MKQTYDLKPTDSHWWGEPVLQEGIDLPFTVEEYADGTQEKFPMSLVCQINCADFIQDNPDNSLAQMLPDKGIISFFANVDYFLGDMDATGEGMGEWSANSFRVLYSRNLDRLRTHKIVDEEGRDCVIPAEPLHVPQDEEEESRVLSRPTCFVDEIENYYPGYITLLQLDSSDRHGLRFYDGGCLFFFISPEDLREKKFEKAECAMFSM